MHRSIKFALLFPGQGSQYPGMAKDFADSYPIARETFEEANDILGRNLSSIVFGGPENILTETKNSQVAIYVSSIAIWRVLKHLFPFLNPAFCTGLSLGEYTALTASDKLSFSEGISLVQKRGFFMNEACETTKGTMAVVLGLDSQEVEELVNQVNMPSDLCVANFNCPGQVVISGTLKGIEAGTAAAKAKGAKRVLPLSVHGAFHSPLMKSAEEKLKQHIEQVPLKETHSELVMNVPGAAVKELRKIREFLIQQVTHSVRWEQGIRYIEKEGVDLFLEVGCGKALTGFNKRIGVSGQSISVEKISEVSNLEQFLNEFK